MKAKIENNLQVEITFPEGNFKVLFNAGEDTKIISEKFRMLSSYAKLIGKDFRVNVVGGN